MVKEEAKGLIGFPSLISCVLLGGCKKHSPCLTLQCFLIAATAVTCACKGEANELQVSHCQPELQASGKLTRLRFCFLYFL